MNFQMKLLSARKKRFSPWWFGLKLGIFAAILTWWWLQNQPTDSGDGRPIKVVLPPDDSEPIAEPVKVTPAPQPEAPPEEPDDLTEIDGIGPKYAQVLTDAGIISFARLAEMDAEEVRQIFWAAVGRAPNPANWIKQAASLK